MIIKVNFNQGTVNTSNVKLLISQITRRLKFISEQSNRFITINKKTPNVEMAVKSIFLKPNSKVLIFNCGIGVLGLVFASIYQKTIFFLYDSNIQNVKLLQKNLKLNRTYTRNASVTTIESLLLKSIDTVIYDISAGFVSLKTLADDIRLVKKLLKQNGLFYCISHTKVGAKRHQEIIRCFFW